MKTLFGVFFALAMLIIASADPARASQIIQTAENIGLVQEQLFGLAIGFDPYFESAGTFNQFDPALGALTGVTIQFSGAVTYDVNFQNNDNCTENCDRDFHVGTYLGFVAPGFQDDVPNTFAQTNFGGTLGGSDSGTQSLTVNLNTVPNCCYYSTVIEVPSYGLLGEFPDGTYAGQNEGTYDGFPYQGLGTLGIDLFAGGDFDFIGNGGGAECADSRGNPSPDCTFSNHVDITTTLTYDYTPAPEPASWMLLLFGLVGLGAFSRARGTW